MISKIKPKKQLGQVFLKEKSILELTAKSLDLKEGDFVLEIGAGIGNLTEAVLAQLKKGRLFALEKDGELSSLLEEKFAKNKNIKIITKDIRKLNLEKFLKENKISKVVGNIPYYLSGWLLREILDLKNYPKIVVLMLQKELGEKILSKESNFFSVAFGLIAKKEKIKTVKAGSFYPVPKVDSLLVKFSFFEEQRPVKFRKDFFAFLRIVFLRPRKTLLSNLKKAGFLQNEVEEVLKDLNLSPKVRAHQLKLEDFLEIFNRLYN